MSNLVTTGDDQKMAACNIRDFMIQQTNLWLQIQMRHWSALKSGQEFPPSRTAPQVHSAWPHPKNEEGKQPRRLPWELERGRLETTCQIEPQLSADWNQAFHRKWTLWLKLSQQSQLKTKLNAHLILVHQFSRKDERKLSFYSFFMELIQSQCMENEWL